MAGIIKTNKRVALKLQVQTYEYHKKNKTKDMFRKGLKSLIKQEQ